MTTDTDTPKISSAGHILAMNNVALTRILQDKPSECLEIFRYALQQLQGSLQAMSSNQVYLAAAASHPPTCATTATPQFQSVPLDTCKTNAAAQSNNGTFSFFHRMMTLSPASLQQTTSTISTSDDNNNTVDTSLLQFQNSLLVTLFFNMAVCHHHLGLRQGKSGELQTALQLYELAFSMVEGSALALKDQQMLLLCLYNNMGHVHSCFSNTAATQACVDWIQRIFLAFPHAQSQPEEEANLAFDYEFFVQYMPLRPCEQGNIAAAA
ncbi:expressed unknown protein [Seminavis robusta]|uniref:Uncharacterized protein n=1 Tax=Seminavis robusta TaxID=568900 RepID=A0A9N8HUF8_9STRA|nr:expressed unknown protein [Seminavis robusta]|eukprot:Sro1378_g267600.1 n/a (267) ;mRNA; r:4045-4845